MDTLSYNARSTLIRIVASSGWQAICALSRRSLGHSSRLRKREAVVLRPVDGRLRAGAQSARLRFSRR